MGVSGVACEAASDAIELQGIYSQRDYTSAFRLYYGWKRWYASLDKIVYLCVAVAVLKVAIDIQAIVPGSLLCDRSDHGTAR